MLPKSFCNCQKSISHLLTAFIKTDQLPCNCRKKEKYPLEGKCRAKDIVYKCIVSATGFTSKVYLRTAQGEFKKPFHNHNTFFKNESKRNDTTLAKDILDLKLKHSVTPTLKWYILKCVVPYLNITKKCRLCLQEKFEILSYPNPDELLNKRSEIVSSFCQLIIKRMIDITLIGTFGTRTISMINI